MLKIKELLTKILQKSCFRTSLYNNTSGSNASIQLSSSAANFDYLEIFFRDNDSVYSSVKVYSPNGKTVNLTCPHSDTGRNTMYFKSSAVYISGTSVTFNRQVQAHMFSNSGGYGVAKQEFIYITHIDGYKVGG